MILIIDNYDSFTYNLVQYIGTLNPNLEVHRNDAITLDEIKKINPERIVISPGPGIPEDAGISVATLRRAKDALGIKPKKDGQNGPWVWRLPAVEDDQDAHD